MKCCDKAYYVIESGVALCRNCGATKAVAAPASPGAWPYAPYQPYLPQTFPYTGPIWTSPNCLPNTLPSTSCIAANLAQMLSDPAKVAFYVGL